MDAKSFAAGFGICTILVIDNAGNWDFVLALLPTLAFATRARIFAGLLVIMATLAFYGIAWKLGFTKRKNGSSRIS